MEGQVIIITGASTGIGADTAEYLCDYGVKLVLVARSPDKLEQVKSRCVAKGLKNEDVLTVIASVASEDDIARIINSTVDTFGRIDHLINNAACMAFEDIQHSTFKSYEVVMNTNLRAPLFLSKEALPHLKQTKGVTVCGILHIKSSFRTSDTSYGPRPGFVVTDTMLHDFPGDKKSEMEEKLAGYAKSSQPLGGGLRMSDVAKTIQFILSDSASAITGECVRVVNGYHLALPAGMGSFSKTNSGLFNAEPTQIRQAKKQTS